jgi:hypothetical protein
MDRLVSVLLLVLIVAVLGVGAVTWRADQQARDRAEELVCLERAHATAAIALLAPGSAVDEQGRLDAMQTLGSRIDKC